MEFIIIGALLVAGGLYWYFNKDAGSLDINKDGDINVLDLKEATKNVKAGVKAELKKLPTPGQLKKKTKAQLVEMGLEFGIELDKKKNKDTMIADLKKVHKAKQK